MNGINEPLATPLSTFIFRINNIIEKQHGGLMSMNNGAENIFN